MRESGQVLRLIRRGRAEIVVQDRAARPSAGRDVVADFNQGAVGLDQFRIGVGPADGDHARLVGQHGGRHPGGHSARRQLVVHPFHKNFEQAGIVARPGRGLVHDEVDEPHAIHVHAFLRQDGRGDGEILPGSIHADERSAGAVSRVVLDLEIDTGRVAANAEHDRRVRREIRRLVRVRRAVVVEQDRSATVSAGRNVVVDGQDVHVRLQDGILHIAAAHPDGDGRGTVLGIRRHARHRSGCVSGNVPGVIQPADPDGKHAGHVGGARPIRIHNEVDEPHAVHVETLVGQVVAAHRVVLVRPALGRKERGVHAVGEDVLDFKPDFLGHARDSENERAVGREVLVLVGIRRAVVVEQDRRAGKTVRDRVGANEILRGGLGDRRARVGAAQRNDLRLPRHDRGRPAAGRVDQDLVIQAAGHHEETAPVVLGADQSLIHHEVDHPDVAGIHVELARIHGVVLHGVRDARANDIHHSVRFIHELHLQRIRRSVQAEHQVRIAGKVLRLDRHAAVVVVEDRATRPSAHRHVVLHLEQGTVGVHQHRAGVGPAHEDRVRVLRHDGRRPGRARSRVRIVEPAQPRRETAVRVGTHVGQFRDERHHLDPGDVRNERGRDVIVLHRRRDILEVENRLVARGVLELRLHLAETPRHADHERWHAGQVAPTPIRPAHHQAAPIVGGPQLVEHGEIADRVLNERSVQIVDDRVAVRRRQASHHPCWHGIDVILTQDRGLRFNREHRQKNHEQTSQKAETTHLHDVVAPNFYCRPPYCNRSHTLDEKIDLSVPYIQTLLQPLSFCQYSIFRS